jgi:predicted outer membrane repeat protein
MQYTNKTLTIFAIGFFTFIGIPAVDAGTIYVDDDAIGANDGTSWADAFTELQSALAVAISGNEIWVAAGTYTPDYDVNTSIHTGDRNATFQLLNGVAIYGGFAGNEDPATFNLDDRDFEANATILSGDLNGDDGPDFASKGENSYRVVTGSGTDSTAILEGCTIVGGNGNGNDWPDQGGSGIFIQRGQPTLRYCTFRGNYGKYGGAMFNRGDTTITNCLFEDNFATWGAVMWNVDENITITNCVFRNNTAKNSGGAIFTLGDNTLLVNCSFSNNRARWGGAIWFDNDILTAINCTFSGNVATRYGGTFTIGGWPPWRAGRLILKNCILWDNPAPGGFEIYATYSINIISINNSDIKGGKAAIDMRNNPEVNWNYGNINEDPLFVRAPNINNNDYGDLHLQPGSPCIDTGNNDALPDGIIADLEGNPRILNGIVDMGAYEFQCIPLNLDILPNDCPNLFTVNTQNKGRLPMAILGTNTFDVTEIDVDTISIADVAFPVKDPSITDESTPVEDGDECACQIGVDGINDLVIHFSRRDIIQALDLDQMEPGTVVPITVEGELLDGTLFEATDCVTLVPRND